MPHTHEHVALDELDRIARRSELRAHLDQLFPNYSSREIDEVVLSTAFIFARCSCGDWLIELKGD